MGEFEYIDWLRARTPPHPRVVVGPGDDCAIVRCGPEALVKTDMLLEGVHFKLEEARPRRVGRKALAVNISDIAAMGGRPYAAVVSVGLPRGAATEALAQELYLGLRELADEFDTAIVGGDTNSWTGGLVICVMLLGEPGPQGPLRRHGAQPGDWLFVTGPLGGSLLGKHLDFTPRVREGLLLQECVPIHAMMDISDGLAADLGHICVESGCGANLRANAIPISDAARQMKDGRSPLEHALHDGEDFELLLAVAPADGERLLAAPPFPGLAQIGMCTPTPGLRLDEGPLEPHGYAHHFDDGGVRP